MEIYSKVALIFESGTQKYIHEKKTHDTMFDNLLIYKCTIYKTMLVC
jgi:hypothetical protein